MPQLGLISTFVNQDIILYMGWKSRNRLTVAQWEALQKANTVDLKRFFYNVDILAVSRYGSRNKAIKALKSNIGYSTAPQTVKAFKVGAFSRVEFDLLRAWCMLFGVSVAEMLSTDMGAEQAAREAAKDDK